MEGRKTKTEERKKRKKKHVIHGGLRSEMSTEMEGSWVKSKSTVREEKKYERTPNTA